MAEAWARHVFSAGWEIYSAGVERHGLNPRMLVVMEEMGIDMTSHTSKMVNELPQKHWDWVITVCDHAAESCPHFRGMKHLHLPFEDPPALTKGFLDAEALPVYRRVRDEIHSAIQQLAKYIGNKQ